MGRMDGADDSVPFDFELASGRARQNLNAVPFEFLKSRLPAGMARLPDRHGVLNRFTIKLAGNDIAGCQALFDFFGRSLKAAVSIVQEPYQHEDNEDSDETESTLSYARTRPSTAV